MNIKEIYKKETGFDAYYFDGTPSKKYMKYLEKREEQLRIGGVRHCTFCEKEIKDTEDVSYTGDAEIAHSKCLQAFEQHWKYRDESLDLMGY